MRRARQSVTPLAALVATLAACGPGGLPPQIDDLPDSAAYVGSEFTLEITASDPDSSGLTFSFKSDIADLAGRASISQYGANEALFRWTPVAGDIGVHAFDFIVSDGANTDTETIVIEVSTSMGEQGAPVFRQPLGTGTTLDLSVATCLDLDVLVEDRDSPSVIIDQEKPVIEGAQLTQQSDFTAVWHWCPTQQQIAAEDRYLLILSASDGENPRTVKNYLIVLRSPPKPDCPGEAPTVSHIPVDEDTLNSLLITAEIGDDLGLKGEPLFYYSTTSPGTSPDLGSMTQLSMLLLDGDLRAGTWGVDVPNPVASLPAGSTATLYYVIVAGDNDDQAGTCDHVTQAPSSGSYQMTVTNPGGSGGLGLCEECTADVQCGGPADNCVRMGSESLYYCFTACTGDTDCPTGYYCSVSAMTSIDGASAKQCIPETYSCGEPPPPTCVDDAYEENDTRATAEGKPALAPGTYSMTSCPAGAYADDEDWYRISITADRQVTVSIIGGSSSDLDLSLVDATGALIVKSDSLTSSESVSSCLVAGTYYIRVYSWDAVENDYTLTFGSTATTCGAGTCSDDPLEDDDDRTGARLVDLDAGAYQSDTNAICAWDDDWFEVYLYSGETLHVTLAFSQATVAEDLDLHLYDSTTDLTPCTEDNPLTCSAANGQSADADENLTRSIATTGTYYVVVHGWNGAENLYDICIGLSATDCPPL